MNVENMIKDFEQDLKDMFIDKGSVNDCKPYLRERWDEVKKDEDFHALATSITKRDDEKLAIDLYSPLVSSLVLMDYDNIDPLIYEILIDVIYSNPKIATLTNLFTNPNYTFLETSLFNPNLCLDDYQIKILLILTSKYNDIRRLVNYGYRVKDEDKEKLYTLIDYCNNFPFLNNAPLDIRYFILTHPIIGKKQEILLNKYNFFMNHNIVCKSSDDELNLICNEFIQKEQKIYEDYKLLLQDSVRRVNIRKMTRMPF